MNQQNMNVDLSSATDVVCEKCESRMFKDIAILKKISALVSPTGKEAIVPIATFACASCGNLNKEFDPDQAKELKQL